MPEQTLTVLFTDLVGSTELVTTRGDQLLFDHFAVLRREIARHQGREVKTLGDGVMATFATARGGVECAIAMQRASTCRSPSVSIRIGVSTGDVRVEHGDCFGTAVIEASRLCCEAKGGQVLVGERTRLTAGIRQELEALGVLELKGLPEPTTVWQVDWSPSSPERVRAVLADDILLVREGIAHVLQAAGIEIAGQAGDADELLRLTSELRPDVAIVDVRMPPTHTDDGLRAAESILLSYPETGVLLLSQDVVPRYAARLRAARATGVGYLLKEQVLDVLDFVATTRSIAAGGSAFAPELAEPCS